MPIWAANLRKGGSSKKGKKGKRPPTYVENIDMLIGSNPISGILQIWKNVSDTYPLNFVKVPVNTAQRHCLFPIPIFTSCSSYSDVVLSGTFDDYGATGPDPYQELTNTTWNVWAHGPDLINARATAWYPWIYAWKPSYGAQILLPFFQNFMAPTHGLPNATGNVIFTTRRNLRF